MSTKQLELLVPRTRRLSVSSPTVARTTRSKLNCGGPPTMTSGDHTLAIA